jgi:hypothetical protein
MFTTWPPQSIRGALRTPLRNQDKSSYPPPNYKGKEGRAVKKAKPNSVKFITFLMVKSKQASQKLYWTWNGCP